MNPINHGQILVHVIFSTKGQAPLIEENLEPLLYDKIFKILYDECYSPSLRIGGGTEHIHILFVQSRNWSIDRIVERVRAKSAIFMRKWIDDFEWQESYAAFTVSRTEDEIEKDYIARQKELHKNVSYKDEFRELLERNGVEYDEEGLWE